ncbi:MAG: hypothetical protein JXN60_04605, partial [Lentisphaerae bacterium]|nr:hypothetical protein [Lentisphaerota bacterium]
MTRKQCLNISSRRYDALIGVGGMGFGQFFALDGNHTLGREESRSGRFMDRCDYCKLHIISHYVHTLLGTDFASYPIGRLGKDEPGDRILREVQNIGMDTRFIEQAEGEQTLFSFCFIYPDGSGGNLTTNNSASGNITTADVAQTEKI